jgi:hypothetical protein
VHAHRYAHGHHAATALDGYTTGDVSHFTVSSGSTVRLADRERTVGPGLADPAPRPAAGWRGRGATGRPSAGARVAAARMGHTPSGESVSDSPSFDAMAANWTRSGADATGAGPRPSVGEAEVSRVTLRTVTPEVTPVHKDQNSSRCARRRGL